MAMARINCGLSQLDGKQIKKIWSEMEHNFQIAEKLMFNKNKSTIDRIMAFDAFDQMVNCGTDFISSPDPLKDINYLIKFDKYCQATQDVLRPVYKL